MSVALPKVPPKFKVIRERTNAPVFTRLFVLRVMVTSEAQVAEQPIFDTQPSGSSTFTSLQAQDVAASKINRPSMMRVIGVTSDVATTESVMAAWILTSETFTVHSRGIVVPNLSVVDVSISQDADALNVNKITIDFEQVALPNFNQYRPQQPADSSSLGIRIQAPVAIAKTATEVYNRVNTYVKGLIK